MYKKVYLIGYIFNIPIKIPLVPTETFPKNPLYFTNVNVESHVSFLSENGSIKRIDSISSSLKDGIIIGRREITNLKNISNINLVSNIENLLYTNKEVDYSRKERQITKGDNKKPVAKGPNMFKVADPSYLFIQRLFRRDKSVTISFEFEEGENASWKVHAVFHIPIIATSILVVIIVIAFDPVIDKGCIKKEIKNLPSRGYSKDLGFKDCPICLEDFNEDEPVKVLNCNHCFHTSCIDHWLLNTLRCPSCRAAVSKLTDTTGYALYRNTEII